MNFRLSFGRGDRLPTIEEFETVYTKMLTTHTPPSQVGIPPIEAVINRSVYEWVHNAAIVARRLNRAEIWGSAVKLAGFRLFTEELGFEPFLSARKVQTPDGVRPGERHNLPPLPDHTPQPGDVSMRFTPNPPQYNVAMRYLAPEDSGIFSEDLLDNGVRILGALSLMPEGSGIAVRDQKGTVYAQTPTFRIAGAEPYPADLRFL
jgi:hypothetical protein